MQLSADEIIDKRIVNNTKKSYKVYSNKFVKWAQLKSCSHLLKKVNQNEYEIIVPVPDEMETIKAFLLRVDFNDKNGNPMLDGKCVIGAGSALNDLYRQKKVKMTDATKLRFRHLCEVIEESEMKKNKREKFQFMKENEIYHIRAIAHSPRTL